MDSLIVKSPSTAPQVPLVVTFLWSEGVREAGTFTPEHVDGLRNMVARHLWQSHQFVCVCSPDYVDALAALDVQTFPLWEQPVKPDGSPGAFTKLGLLGEHGAAMARVFESDRFLVSDLDVIVRGNIDDLIDGVREHDVRFLEFQTRKPFILQRGVQKRRGYSGAWWGGRLGSRPATWRACFDPDLMLKATSTFYGTDQAVASYTLGLDLPRWTERDGLLLRGMPGSREARVELFAGIKERKPWNLERDGTAAEWRKQAAPLT